MRTHHLVPETTTKLLLTWVNAPDPNLRLLAPMRSHQRLADGGMILASL